MMSTRPRRGSKYGAIDESDAEELGQPTKSCLQPGGNERHGCFVRYVVTFFVWFFTDWPCETVKLISTPYNRPTPNRPTPNTIQEERREPNHDDKPESEQPNIPKCYRCSTKRLCRLIGWSLLTTVRLLLVLTGIVFQFITCFRRDRISTDLTPITPSTTTNETTKLLSCTERDEIICALLIPDIVIFLLALWVYFGLKFVNQFSPRCCGCKELNVVIMADTADKLNELVLTIKPKQLGSSITSGYIAIPALYILLSQGVSVMYLFAFHLADEDVVIQPPLQGMDRLTGGLKSGMIALSFVGFIALDLLYVRVIIRYAYRCQMIIYYLEMIKKNINDFQNGEERIKRNQQRSVRENQNLENEGEEITDDNIVSCEDKKAQEVAQENENAYMFIKYLNASSSTVGFIILIASYQAADCAAVFLLDNDITYFQGGAVVLRLILWGFLAVFPFHKAAGVNIAFKRLRDLGWDIYAPLLGGPYESNNTRKQINLKARVFGISVNPWLPYVVVIVLLLTIMIGAKFKWYEHVL